MHYTRYNSLRSAPPWRRDSSSPSSGPPWPRSSRTSSRAVPEAGGGGGGGRRGRGRGRRERRPQPVRRPLLLLLLRFQALPPPASVARYRAARDTYLRQRTSDLFLQHLASFDGAGFSYPPPSDPGQEGALAGREERSRAQLAELAASVEDRLGTVRARYAALVERREELGRIVSEMEEREEDGGAGRAAEEDDDATMGPGGGGGGEDGDVDVDDEEMASQEERLAGLIERKAEVEARLRRVRAQRASVDADVGANRREVAELRRRNAGKGAAAEEEVQNQ